MTNDANLSTGSEATAAQKEKVSQIPCYGKSGPQQNFAKSQWHHPGQNHWWSHVGYNKEGMDGQSCAGRGQLWDWIGLDLFKDDTSFRTY